MTTSRKTSKKKNIRQKVINDAMRHEDDGDSAEETDTGEASQSSQISLGVGGESILARVDSAAEKLAKIDGMQKPKWSKPREVRAGRASLPDANIALTAAEHLHFTQGLLRGTEKWPYPLPRSQHLLSQLRFKTLQATRNLQMRKQRLMLRETADGQERNRLLDLICRAEIRQRALKTRSHSLMRCANVLEMTARDVAVEIEANEDDLERL